MRVIFWEDNGWFWQSSVGHGAIEVTSGVHGPFRSDFEAQGHYQFWKCSGVMDTSVQPELPFDRGVLPKQDIKMPGGGTCGRCYVGQSCDRHPRPVFGPAFPDRSRPLTKEEQEEHKRTMEEGYLRAYGATGS